MPRNSGDSQMGEKEKNVVQPSVGVREGRHDGLGSFFKVAFQLSSEAH